MYLLAEIESWMLLAGLVLLTFVMMRRSWTRGRKVSSKRNDTRVRPLTGKQQPSHESLERDPFGNAPSDVLQWHVKMHETARDMQGELDSKIAGLQVLIRMARQESERLENLLERRDL